ncbi:vesicle-associated membrane protein [Thraustotheca clavata]|uniref:Vesicle-associated membrane protein n=1 Tax=Thraustotheca clavata TaxID=74557 RepID=A0A1W0A2I1_9STRA|nr:vesicle-associated membrane protein [Thraustotheca clavata]
MPISYCVVGNKHCALAEYSSTNNGANTSLLSTLSPTNGSKKVKEIAASLLTRLNFEKRELEMDAIDCDGQTYSYLVDDEIAYICVADATVGKAAVTAFLKHIKTQFDEQFGIRGKMTKLKLDMQRDFAPILKNNMELMSSKGGMQKLDALRKDLDNVKESMQVNIGKVLERGDKIELLVDKSESLNSSADAFAKSSRDLRRALWLQNVKMYICAALVILVLIVLMVLYFKKKTSSSDKATAL